MLFHLLFLGGPTIRTLAHLWGLGEEELSALLCVGEKKKKEVKKNSTTASYTHSRQVGWKHPCKEARECVTSSGHFRCWVKWSLIAGRGLWQGLPWRGLASSEITLFLSSSSFPFQGILFFLSLSTLFYSLLLSFHRFSTTAFLSLSSFMRNATIRRNYYPSTQHRYINDESMKSTIAQLAHTHIRLFITTSSSFLSSTRFYQHWTRAAIERFVKNKRPGMFDLIKNPQPKKKKEFSVCILGPPIVHSFTPYWRVSYSNGLHRVQHTHTT